MGNNTESSHLFTDVPWLAYLHKQKSQFIILIGTMCSSLPTNLVRVACRDLPAVLKLLWRIMNPIPPKGTREKKINSCTLFANCGNQMQLYFVSAHFGINLKTLDRNIVQLPRGVYTHLSMSENFTANEIYEYEHSGKKKQRSKT